MCSTYVFCRYRTSCRCRQTFKAQRNTTRRDHCFQRTITAPHPTQPPSLPLPYFAHRSQKNMMSVLRCWSAGTAAAAVLILLLGLTTVESKNFTITEGGQTIQVRSFTVRDSGALLWTICLLDVAGSFVFCAANGSILRASIISSSHCYFLSQQSHNQ